MKKDLMKKTLGVLIVVIFITTGLSAGVSSGHDMPASVLNKNGNDASIRLSTKYYDDNCFDKGPGELINEIDRGSPSACLKAIDYDGDGDMDYIEGSNEFVFIATNTDGHFEKTMVYNFFLSPDPDSGNINMLVYGGITVGDFNNDGQQDFITGGAMGNIRLFVNNDSQPGFPNFDNYTIARFGQAAYGLDVADFNEDGWLDFAVSWATEPLGYSTITLFYNKGNFSFTQKDVYQLEPEYYIEDLNVGDYDNDGDIDIIFLKTLFEWHGHNPPWPINVIGAYYLLENTGDETFGSERLIAERGRGVSFWLGLRFYLTVQSRIRNYYGFNRINPHITSADFDEDGDIDFLIGDNSGMVEFFRNDGQGNFVSDGVIHRYGYLSWGLASADFDGDGDIDFLVAALDKYDDPSLGHIWLKENQLNPSKTNGQPDGCTIASDKMFSLFSSILNNNDSFINQGNTIHEASMNEPVSLEILMERMNSL